MAATWLRRPASFFFIVILLTACGLNAPKADQGGSQIASGNNSTSTSGNSNEGEGTSISPPEIPFNIIINDPLNDSVIRSDSQIEIILENPSEVNLNDFSFLWQSQTLDLLTPQESTTIATVKGIPLTNFEEKFPGELMEVHFLNLTIINLQTNSPINYITKKFWRNIKPKIIFLELASSIFDSVNLRFTVRSKVSMDVRNVYIPLSEENHYPDTVYGCAEYKNTVGSNHQDDYKICYFTYTVNPEILNGNNSFSIVAEDSLNEPSNPFRFELNEQISPTGDVFYDLRIPPNNFLSN